MFLVIIWMHYHFVHSYINNNNGFVFFLTNNSFNAYLNFVLLYKAFCFHDGRLPKFWHIHKQKRKNCCGKHNHCILGTNRCVLHMQLLLFLYIDLLHFSELLSNHYNFYLMINISSIICLFYDHVLERYCSKSLS